MASVNKVILVGNLGRDPEMRYSPSGQAKAEFSLATSRSWKKDDEWQEESTWHNVVIWGQRAERAAEQLRKGMQAYVEGRIDNRSWDDPENPGKKKYRSEVVADVVYKMGRRDDDQQDAGSFEAPAGGFGAPAPRSKTAVEDLGDLPF